jgi:hypothetical protein
VAAHRHGQVGVVLLDGAGELQGGRNVQDVEAGNAHDAGSEVAQDATEGPAFEAKVDDAYLVAGSEQGGSHVFETQRLRLEERRQSELDSGWPGLD